MKIIAINNYHYHRGGSEFCYLNFNEILEKHGHEVVSFSMKTPQNVPSQWEDYFINEVKYEDLNIMGKLRNMPKIIYSFEAKNNLKRLLDNTKPDIAHMHNIYHHISPSVIDTVKAYGLPAVMTLHDLKLLCPNYKMLRQTGICELCKGGRFYRAAIHKCLKGSLPLSILISLEMYIHRFLKIYRKLDLLISPSQFLRNKFVEHGFSGNRVVYVPNYVQIERYMPDFETGDYILYAGRLVEEKGVNTLVSAMAKLKNIRLKIVGTGPEKERIEANIKQLRLDNIELLGYKKPSEIAAIYKKAKFLVLPSEWYENAPISVLEAFAYGKPVIGADIGGIPELVNNNENGLLFISGQAENLAEKIGCLASDNNRIRKLGENARAFVEKQFSPQVYYQKILSIYEELINGRGLE